MQCVFDTLRSFNMIMSRDVNCHRPSSNTVRAFYWKVSDKLPRGTFPGPQEFGCLTHVLFVTPEIFPVNVKSIPLVSNICAMFESLGELEKAVETLVCGSCSHSISRSPKLSLVFL